MTVGDVIDRVAGDLGAAGIEDPRREALVLWASMAGVSPGQAWLDRDTPAPREMEDRVETAAARRAGGAPSAYATGSVAFRTLTVKIDGRALIPRPETEGLVGLVLAHFRARDLHRSAPLSARRRPPAPVSWGTVADIGTGSGCIALSLAVEGRFDRVMATDVDPEALALARENGAMPSGQGGQSAPPLVDYRLGDLLVPLGGSPVDAIVSNPPYVTDAEWAALDPGVRDHEPRVALVSADGGLSHTRALLGGARALLRDGGLLAIEVDSARADRVLLIARDAGWADARLERDLFGRLRYLLATKGSQ